MTRKQMIKKIGKGLRLSNGSNLIYKADDIFLIFQNGRVELLLKFDLIEKVSGFKAVKIKKSLLVDEVNKKLIKKNLITKRNF